MSYLTHEGVEVEDVVDLEHVDRRLAEGHRGLVIVHADLVPEGARLGEASGAGGRDHRIVALCPDSAAEERLHAQGAILCWPEPYVLRELTAALRRQEKALPESAGEGLPGGQVADEDLQARVLASVSRALSPHLAAADGWMQLLLQDMDPSDPAHRHLAHGRREVRELDRILRLMRLAADDSEPFLAAVQLGDLVHEVVAHTGGAAIPLAVHVADELPEVKADPRLCRVALECLLKGCLEAAGRPRSISIRAQASDREVLLELVEEGHRLDDRQLRALCASGLSLLYNSFGRGLGYPMARRMMTRQGVAFEIEAAEGRRLFVRMRFPSVGAARGRGTRGADEGGGRIAEDDA